MSEIKKPIRYTKTTKMVITIKSRVTNKVQIETATGVKDYNREFQRMLHEGIAWAIFNNIEWARDDTDNFDDTTYEKVDISFEDYMDKLEISDFAEIELTYEHGKTKYKGERVMTKAERNYSPQQSIQQETGNG